LHHYFLTGQALGSFDRQFAFDHGVKQISTKVLNPSQQIGRKEVVKVALLSDKALKKWDELDQDRSGKLDSKRELRALAAWILSSFRPGKTVSEAECDIEAVKILKRCDVDKDGMIDKKEFKAYYEKTAGAMLRYNRDMVEKTNTSEEEKKAEVLKENPASTSGLEKFRAKRLRAVYGSLLHAKLRQAWRHLVGEWMLARQGLVTQLYLHEPPLEETRLVFTVAEPSIESSATEKKSQNEIKKLREENVKLEKELANAIQDAARNEQLTLLAEQSAVKKSAACRAMAKKLEELGMRSLEISELMEEAEREDDEVEAIMLGYKEEKSQRERLERELKDADERIKAVERSLYDSINHSVRYGSERLKDILVTKFGHNQELRAVRQWLMNKDKYKHACNSIARTMNLFYNALKPSLRAAIQNFHNNYIESRALMVAMKWAEISKAGEKLVFHTGSIHKFARVMTRIYSFFRHSALRHLLSIWFRSHMIDRTDDLIRTESAPLSRPNHTKPMLRRAHSLPATKDDLDHLY